MVMLVYIRILMSTIAPKLSEFAMNTYSFPYDRVNSGSTMGGKGISRLMQTCESSKSSFPLFISDGKISPWPGGYLKNFI
jgi:hypothetical protein